MNALVCGVAQSVLVISGIVSPPQGFALGYVGPAGVGALGVLLVVALVLVIGAVGLVLHPVRLILRHRRRLRQEQDEASHESVSPRPPIQGSH